MTDSQLSAAVRAGKLNYSQDRNKTSEDSEEWSQNTKKMLSNGSYVLPGLSQGGVDLVEADIKGMEEVRLQIESKQNISTEILAKDACFLAPKKRTDRIHLLQREVLELNKSLEVFSPPISPQDSLMNSSFNDSAMTVTQKQLDSQSPIKYLRQRTPDEQRKHKLQKEVEKAIKKTPKEEPSKIHELPHCVEEPVVEQEATGAPRVEHVFSEDVDEPRTNLNALPPSDEEMETDEEDFLRVEVGAARSKKISDFVAIELQNDDRYLWARMGVDVPIRVEWRVSEAPKSGVLKLRIRLIHYDKFMKIEQAMHVAHSDVKKCRHHTDIELDSPSESFFYVHSPDITWVPATEEEKTEKGHSFSAELPTSKKELDLELKFACQEKCMGLEERRKIMCLVVFLEDDVGHIIKYAVFKEVRVVAYPRRDFKNFHAKRVDSNHPTVSTKRPSARLPEMLNCTNTPKMLPSSSRKRAIKSESSPEIDVVGGSEYERRLMLGGSYRAPELGEQMEVENLEEVVSKRTRYNDTFSPIYLEDDYERDLVLSVLAEKRRNDRARVNSLILPQRHPFSLQGAVTPETRIDVWLNTLGPAGKQHYVRLFDKFQIYCIQQLTNRFDIDPEIFSRLGLEPGDVKPIRHIFLNYYRVFQADMLMIPDSKFLK